MCSNTGSDCCCCPSGVIFTEKLCGNITDPIDQIVWSAPEESDYIQGTFEVTNNGPGTIDFSVNGDVYTVPTGSSKAVSVNNPTEFIVQTIGQPGALPGTTGKWCITLYKRVIA